MYVNGDKRETLTPVQFYIDKDIYIKGADKVLAVNARVRVDGAEATDGEMRVNYRITYKVIYSESDVIKSMEESSDHNARIKSASITPKSYVEAEASVISLEHVGDSNLKIRTMLELEGYAVVPCGFEHADISDDVYARYKPVTMMNITPINYAETVAENTEFIKENITEILTADTDVRLENVSIATDICELTGVCYTHTAYVADGIPGSACISYPFTLEVPSPGIKEGDELRVSVCSKLTGVTITEGDGGTELNIQTVLFARGVYVSRDTTEVPVDVYSKSRDVKPVTSTVSVESDVCMGSGKDRFGSGFTPDDGKGCAKVLCVGAPWIGAKNVIASDGIRVEGIVCCEIVYVDLDDERKRLLAEIPYSVAIDGDMNCSGNMQAKVTVAEHGAKVRRSNEIEAYGVIYAEVFGVEEQEVSYVEEIKDFGEAIPNDAVISLYIVGKGETLFDVAKALRSDEEELLAMNPDAELPLKEGDKLIRYGI